MATDELCWTAGTELARMVRAKDVSPVDIVEAFLARIERINPRINAYCTVTADQARAAPREAEAAAGRGQRVGPLHGGPFSLKDLTPPQGIPTTIGAKIFEHNVPPEHALPPAR